MYLNLTLFLQGLIDGLLDAQENHFRARIYFTTWLRYAVRHVRARYRQVSIARGFWTIWRTLCVILEGDTSGRKEMATNIIQQWSRLNSSGDDFLGWRCEGGRPFCGSTDGSIFSGTVVIGVTRVGRLKYFSNYNMPVSLRGCQQPPFPTGLGSKLPLDRY